jgi:hypothetical protein
LDEIDITKPNSAVEELPCEDLLFNRLGQPCCKYRGKKDPKKGKLRLCNFRDCHKWYTKEFEDEVNEYIARRSQ